MHDDASINLQLYLSDCSCAKIAKQWLYIEHTFCIKETAQIQQVKSNCINTYCVQRWLVISQFSCFALWSCPVVQRQRWAKVRYLHKNFCFAMYSWCSKVSHLFTLLHSHSVMSGVTALELVAWEFLID